LARQTVCNEVARLLVRQARIHANEIAFIQVESEDENNLVRKETKLVKNLKWAAKKKNTSNVLLHSFAHLSESKADPTITKNLFDSVEMRLKRSGFEIGQTPFGYFLNLEIKTPGYSLARIFKDL